MNCTYCGRPIEPNAWRCSGCGAAVESNENNNTPKTDNILHTALSKVKSELKFVVGPDSVKSESIYKCAGLIQRTLAIGIDLLVAVMIFGVLSSIINDDVGGYVMILYLILTDSKIFGGQSIGKLIMKLRVIGLNNEPIGILRAIVRIIPKIMSIVFPPLLIGYAIAIFTKDNRSLYDFICRTQVVKLN